MVQQYYVTNYKKRLRSIENKGKNKFIKTIIIRKFTLLDTEGYSVNFAVLLFQKP